MIATATRPMCNPKITNTCQKAPTINPAAIGLNAYTHIIAFPITVANQFAIGPITMKPSGAAIKRTIIGTKNVLTTSGITFFNVLSKYEAKKFVKRIGKTVDVYVTLIV